MAEKVSIIVPTFHEAENLPHLLQRISASLDSSKIDWEVIVVDDNSQDETVQVCESLAQTHPLTLIVRTKERGLASAVVAGMKAAQSEFLLCMDADLSHPPEAIPSMIESFSDGKTDFVIGSRYVEGGSTDDDWGVFRWLNSIIATGLAKPLTSAKDPMAGFFALRRSDFQAAYETLDPVGYKIGLELIVKCNCQKVTEVPIHFSDRQFGESKLSFKEQLNYLKHLSKLYDFKWPEATRFFRFGMVGFSGVFINLAALAVLLEFSMLAPVAMAVAIWIAMSWNFLLNREVTFHDRTTTNIGSEYVRFCMASLTGAALNWSVATLLWTTVPMFADSPTIAGLVGIVAGMFANFTLCRRFVFFAKEQNETPQQQESLKKERSRFSAGS